MTRTMNSLGELWAGRIFGTNTGNAFAEFAKSEDQVSGVLRIRDDGQGVLVYDVTGTFEDGRLKLQGSPRPPADGLELGELTVAGGLTPEGHLRGTWETTIGTGGTFELLPHGFIRAQSQERGAAAPEQIHSATRALGAIRLYAFDVERLISRVTEDFQTKRAVVTYVKEGTQVTRYSNEFLEDYENSQPLLYLKVTIQEPESYGINRVVTVDLGAFSNTVNVQGVQESWVIGKAETVAQELRLAQKRLITSFRRFGVGLVNPLIFFTMLVFIPELDALWRRAAFVAVVVLLLSLLLLLHRRFIPNFVAFPGPERPGIFRRSWPSIVSWVGAATASLAAALTYVSLIGGD